MKLQEIAVLVNEITKLKEGDRSLISKYKKLISVCPQPDEIKIYSQPKIVSDLFLEDYVGRLLYLEAIGSDINTDYIYEEIFNICKTVIENEIR